MARIHRRLCKVISAKQMTSGKAHHWILAKKHRHPGNLFNFSLGVWQVPTFPGVTRLGIPCSSHFSLEEMQLVWPRLGRDRGPWWNLEGSWKPGFSCHGCGLGWTEAVDQAKQLLYMFIILLFGGRDQGSGVILALFLWLMCKFSVHILIINDSAYLCQLYYWAWKWMKITN